MADTYSTGDDYQTVEVDYGRAGAHTTTLTGTDLWSDTTNSNPLDDLQDWATLVAKNEGRSPGQGDSPRSVRHAVTGEDMNHG